MAKFRSKITTFTACMFKVYYYAVKINQVFISVLKSSTISELVFKLQLKLPSAPFAHCIILLGCKVFLRRKRSSIFSEKTQKQLHYLIILFLPMFLFNGKGNPTNKCNEIHLRRHLGFFFCRGGKSMLRIFCSQMTRKRLDFS